MTEDRENTEEIIRGLRNQLLAAQQDRDNLQLELDKVIHRSSNEKARLDRLLLVAAKETARVEEEKLKLLMELATFKDKAVQDKAASEAEMRRLRAELAMSNRHEGEDDAPHPCPSPNTPPALVLTATHGRVRARAEFLARQLEEQRLAAEARMHVQLERSSEELTQLGREVEDLRERCGRLAQGKSLALMASRRRTADGADDSSSDEEP